jgi:hypothetical protein
MCLIRKRPVENPVVILTAFTFLPYIKQVEGFILFLPEVKD